jgi:hypothetical protein
MSSSIMSEAVAFLWGYEIVVPSLAVVSIDALFDVCPQAWGIALTPVLLCDSDILFLDLYLGDVLMCLPLVQFLVFREHHNSWSLSLFRGNTLKTPLPSMYSCSVFCPKFSSVLQFWGYFPGSVMLSPRPYVFL